ncbi:hypothetical protein BC827DRAFT_1155622 [Russula dissimulans]|nr:hypothetical protein BC827DRAFT_1155622 [Russula dissimulans]
MWHMLHARCVHLSILCNEEDEIRAQRLVATRPSANEESRIMRNNAKDGMQVRMKKLGTVVRWAMTSRKATNQTTSDAGSTKDGLSVTSVEVVAWYYFGVSHSQAAMQADGEMVRQSAQAATVHGITVATAAMALQCSHCADIAIALLLPSHRCCHCVAVAITSLSPSRRCRHRVTVAIASLLPLRCCRYCVAVAIVSLSPLVWCPSVLGRQRQAPHSLCDAWPSMEGGDQRGMIGCNDDVVKYELGKKKKKRKSGVCRWLRQLVKCDAAWCLMAVVIAVSTLTSSSASAIDHREILRMTSKLFMDIQKNFWRMYCWSDVGIQPHSSRLVQSRDILVAPGRRALTRGVPGGHRGSHMLETISIAVDGKVQSPEPAAAAPEEERVVLTAESSGILEPNLAVWKSLHQGSGWNTYDSAILSHWVWDVSTCFTPIGAGG